MNDLALLAKLKIRHARTALAWVMHATGSDVIEDSSVMERLYQLYCVAALGVCAVLMWLALLDFAEEAFLGLGSDGTLAVFRASLFAFPLLFAATGIRYLRACPLTLTSADISYVAASPLSSSSLMLCAAAIRSCGLGLLAFFAGYLFGACLQSGLGVLVPPLNCAALVVLAVIASLLGGWIVGVVRLSRKSPRRYPLVLGALLVLLLSLAAPLFIALAGLVPDSAAVASALTQGFLGMSAALALIIVVEFLMLKARSAQVSMTKAIDENAFYADMHALRHMPLDDATGYKELRRRRRTTARKPRGRVPFKVGSAALASRAMLSHLRQFEGLPSVLFWGAFAAPTAVVLLLNPPEEVFMLFMVWVMVLIAYPAGVREMTRAFRDDIRNKMIRTSLPVNTMRLLVYDTAPSFVVASLISILVIVLSQQVSQGLLGGLILSVAINAVLVLCASFDGLRLSTTKRGLSYEAAVIVCILVMLLASFTGIPVLIVAVAYLCVLALAALVTFSEE